MPDSEKAALNPAQRRKVAEELEKVAETFAEVPGGPHTAHALGLLAHLPDPRMNGRDRSCPSEARRKT